MLKILLALTSLIVTVSAWEMWWRVEGTTFGFDEMFRWNLKAHKNLEHNHEKKLQLIEFLRFNNMAKIDLDDHNKRTDFHPKHQENRVIIPYMTHTIYVTKPDERSVMDRPNVWEMVEKLGEDINDGVEWKHIFWTNDRSSVVINATACEGRCEVRLFNQLPGFQEVESLVNQMIDTNLFILDVLKPMILYQFGGVYLSRDFYFERSFRFLHQVMDSYMGFEGMNWPGISPGVIGTRPKHQAMEDWKNFVLAYYGFRKDVYGTQDLMPMPTFREDIISTSGPRGLTFAVWANLNKWGNNDCIFKTSMLALDTQHGSYRQQKKTGEIMDDHPKIETITIGGREHDFERFGYYRFERDYGFRTKSGHWHVPKDLMWKLPDGSEEVQLWLMDMTDRKDILSPNYVAKDTLLEYRKKYDGKKLVQEIFFDNWFTQYFKTYDGRYADRLVAKKGEFDEEERIRLPIMKDEL